MADEKVKEVKKIKANGKQFAKKKTARFNVEECRTELNRMEGANQTTCDYYEDVMARYLSLGGGLAK